MHLRRLFSLLLSRRFLPAYSSESPSHRQRLDHRHADFHWIHVGEIGWLALAWTVLEASEPPKQMRAGVVCSITYWGAAASDSGYEVHLYKIWNWAPFLQREVFFTSVDQTVGQPEMSCTDVMDTMSELQEHRLNSALPPRLLKGGWPAEILRRTMPRRSSHRHPESVNPSLTLLISQPIAILHSR